MLHRSHLKLVINNFPKPTVHNWLQTFRSLRKGLNTFCYYTLTVLEWLINIVTVSVNAVFFTGKFLYNCLCFFVALGFICAWMFIIAGFGELILRYYHLIK